MMFVAQKTLTPLTVDSDTIEEFYQPYPFPTIDNRFSKQSTSIDTLVYSNGGTEGDWGKLWNSISGSTAGDISGWIGILQPSQSYLQEYSDLREQSNNWKYDLNIYCKIW